MSMLAKGLDLKTRDSKSGAGSGEGDGEQYESPRLQRGWDWGGGAESCALGQGHVAAGT